MPSILDLSRNFSFYTVPAAWTLSMAPFAYAFITYNKISPDDPFDRVNPRTFMSALENNERVDQTMKGRLRRAWAASQNGFEKSWSFAAAVVGANAARLDPWWTNTLSTAYLISRVGFNATYIYGYPGEVRGIFFYTGISLVFSLFIMSGNAIRRLSA